jgi:hypothetical protein
LSISNLNHVIVNVCRMFGWHTLIFVIRELLVSMH